MPTSDIEKERKDLLQQLNNPEPQTGERLAENGAGAKREAPAARGLARQAEVKRRSRRIAGGGGSASAPREPKGKRPTLTPASGTRGSASTASCA